MCFPCCVLLCLSNLVFRVPYREYLNFKHISRLDRAGTITKNIPVPEPIKRPFGVLSGKVKEEFIFCAVVRHVVSSLLVVKVSPPPVPLKGEAGSKELNTQGRKVCIYPRRLSCFYHSGNNPSRASRFRGAVAPLTACRLRDPDKAGDGELNTNQHFRNSAFPSMC